MNVKKIFTITVILIGITALGGMTGCGTSQIRFADSTADLPSGGDDGDGDTGGGTTPTLMSVEGVFPINGASGVVLGTSFSLTFSAPLLASSLPNNVSVSLVGPVTSISAPIKSISGSVSKATDVPGSPSLGEDDQTITFTADDDYEDCSIFEITVSGGADGVQGSDGSQLAENFTSQFMSACPAMLNEDVDGGYDMGYSGAIDDDNLYVGAGGFAPSGYSYSNVYKPLVDKIDTSTGLGSSVWGGAYIPVNGELAYPTTATAVDIVVLDEIIGTAGYERGLFVDDSYTAYGWLQSLASDTGDGDDPSNPDGQFLFFGEEMFCKCLAKSPVIERVALLCHSTNSATPMMSYIMTIDINEVDPPALGLIPSSNDQMFKRGAFDSSGNLYITWATYNGYWDLQANSVLALDVYTSAELIGPDIYAPVAFATFATPYSNGTDVAIAEENGSPVFYVTGLVDSSQGGTLDVDALLVKFDAQGNTLWSETYSGLDIDGHDTFNAVAVDDDGNVYVTGSRARVSGRTQYDDMILAKYSSTGEQQFLVTYKMGVYGDSDQSVGNDVLLNDDGEIFVVGGVYDGAEDWNIAAWRFDNDGNNGGVF